MKRRLFGAVMLALIVSLLILPASAANTASRVEVYATVHTNGDCQVTSTVTIHLESTQTQLTYPLPLGAKNISVNGGSARTSKTASCVEVDISRLVQGMVGDFTIRFDYTIPDAVQVSKELNDAGERTLSLELPLLNGFSYPVDSLSFTVVLPSQVGSAPRFTSTYHQIGIDSALVFITNTNMITGSSTTQLNDQESLQMSLAVSREMFPGVSTYMRTGNPEVRYILICVGLAMVYWLLFLRTMPLRRSRSITAPSGFSAGEVGCRLTLSGGDLTMMVMTWARLGYVLIQLDGNGRVLVHKRMEMGNERSRFEMRVFQLLFGSRRTVDATGIPYAKLCRKVQTMIPGERTMYTASTGNMKLFRWLCCAGHGFCGVCVAMNLTGIVVLQVIFSVILFAFGCVTAWSIQGMAYRTHIRGKVPVYIGLVCVALWVLLGVLCGQVLIPTLGALGQMVRGYFAAYGGRRSDMGRYDAGLLLGLRAYLKKIPPEELERNLQYDPDYFFHMAPYALALGVIHPFAKNFGDRKLEQCPYLLSRIHGNRTAAEWAALMAAAADAMDDRQRRMMVEQWLRIKL